MTYGHLQADCLYIGISSGPNTLYRVWEAFTLQFYCFAESEGKRVWNIGLQLVNLVPIVSHFSLIIASSALLHELLQRSTIYIRPLRVY